MPASPPHLTKPPLQLVDEVQEVALLSEQGVICLSGGDEDGWDGIDNFRKNNDRLQITMIIMAMIRGSTGLRLSEFAQISEFFQF